MPEKWRLEGTLFDACNCTTLCPCNYGQVPTNPTDCRVMAVWRINRGNYGGVRLDGLHLAMILNCKGNPLTVGAEQAAMVVDEGANPQQREALMNILGGKAGGLFAMLGSMVKQNLGVSFARFAYQNDEKTWSVKAGNALEFNGSFVKPPPGMSMEPKPMRAQTLDPLFSPTMDKVVGISDKHKVNVAGLVHDFTGKYSSSGKFVYEGG